MCGEKAVCIDVPQISYVHPVGGRAEDAELSTPLRTQKIMSDFHIINMELFTLFDLGFEFFHFICALALPL